MIAPRLPHDCPHDCPNCDTKSRARVRSWQSDMAREGLSLTLLFVSVDRVAQKLLRGMVVFRGGILSAVP